MVGRFIKVLSLIGVAALALSGAARAEEITLKLHHFLPPMSPFHSKFMAAWAERVTKQSNGRLKVQVYPSMQLGGTPPQIYDQIKDGVVDIGWTVAGYSAGRFPAFEVFELPFMVNSASGGSRALWEYVHVNKLDKTEFKDVKLLATHQHDEPHFHMVDKPIKTLADLKGMKVRAPTRITNKLLTALGATPVGMPVTQVSDALSKGVINGTLLPWEVVPSIKVHELVKFHSEIDPKSQWLYATVFVFAMNPAKYASLPPDLQKIIDANSGVELSASVGKMADEEAIPGRKQAKDHGNTFNTISMDELKNWQAAAQTVTDDWIKDLDKRGLDGKALVNSARELIAKYDKK
jgi:TRAP-type transport system periplasmic protein